ncbi:MAG: hypothetical protein Q9195_003942 [Heterodermia aff. obscurata]
MDQLQIPRVGFSNWIVPNLSISLVNEIYTTLPDGTSYPVQAGNLALGSAVNQSFTTSSGPSINASLIPGWFYEQGVTGNTYGLHIGSAAMGIPLSLWLGGYDRSRVLGPVSSQPCFQNRLRIDLLDLGIGVDNGASPFNFSSRQNILDQGNSSMGDSTSVIIDSLFTYRPKFQLYVWDVNDADYGPIVTSPSFLSFTFRASNLPQSNLTIKVPFQLLNLTLEAPISSEPTQYFPCRPPLAGGGYTLGRAFLQAAFVGVDWNSDTGTWFLAQAPGPNTAKTPQQETLTTTVSSSSDSWSDSWAGHWTPIKETSSTINSTNATAVSGNTASTESSTPKAGLSAGAKAGIGVGCGLVGALLIGIGLYLYRSHSHSRLASASSSQQTASAMTSDDPSTIPLKGYYQPQDRQDQAIAEAPGPEPVELTGAEQPAIELGSGQAARQELGTDSR